MSQKHIYSSLTRIASFTEENFLTVPLPREVWATGDYVVGEVTVARGPLAHVELTHGRMAEVAPGDLVVGAFGHRAATLESVGSWRAIGDDLLMQALTSAGLFGKATSWSARLRRMVSLVYRGHVMIDGDKCRMGDAVEEGDATARRAEPVDLGAPVILLIGTSMAAGKTTAAKILIRMLKREERRVVGAKVTGAGRYRDILSMADAGADAIFDFVDVGLPSTICDEALFRARLTTLLGRIADAQPEVVVIEAGASPLEPYQADVAIDALGDQVRATVLCASDPYAALGVMRAFDTSPDLITGIGASTSAAIALIEKLTDVPAVDLLHEDAAPVLHRLLQRSISTPKRPRGSRPPSR